MSIQSGFQNLKQEANYQFLVYKCLELVCFKACKAFFTHNTGSFDLNSEGEKTDWSKLF